MTWFKLRRTRKRAMGGAAVGVVVATALVAQMSMVSNASWNDAEWVNAGAVGTVDCTDPEGAFATRGEGRAISGSALGIDLDTLAEASGVEVKNNGIQVPALVNPTDANLAPADPAYADPLDVTALSLINVNLGKGMLQLPLDNSTGVIGQFGSASTKGVAEGAAGFINESGGIATRPGSGYPNLATLDLKQLLTQVNPTVANTLGDVSNLSLAVGALTGRAQLDGCASQWDGITPRATAQLNAGNLEREYLTSHVRTNITADAVGDLVQAVSGTINSVNSTIAGLTSSTALVNGIVGGVLDLLGTLLLGLVDPTVEVTKATIELDPVSDLLEATLQDSGGILTIDLKHGIVSIDTSALLAAAYPAKFGNGLNSLPPNTDLFTDPEGKILPTLAATLTGLLSGWLTQVNTKLIDAINGITIEAVVQIKVSVVVTVTAQVNGSLTDLESGNGVTTSTSGLVAILKPLVDGIVAGLVNGLGATVATAVKDVVLPLVASIPTLASPVVEDLLSSISGLYSSLFLSDVVQIVVNAQNDPFSGETEPSDWVTKPNSGVPEGQYDVAALRIGVLGLLSENDVRLYLGRGSVGPVCSQADVAAGGCTNY